MIYTKQDAFRVWRTAGRILEMCIRDSLVDARTGEGDLHHAVFRIGADVSRLYQVAFGDVVNEFRTGPGAQSI